MDDTGTNTVNGRREARSTLQFAVENYGQRVLSNASIIEGICEDRLPDFPREASLITNAAKADVATMLAQQVAGVGPDTAVRLTATTLAQSRSLDPAGCIWVVSEFARCLGYDVSEDLVPAATPPLEAPVAGAQQAPAAGAATVDPAPSPGVGSPLDPGITVPPFLDAQPSHQPNASQEARAPRTSRRRRITVIGLAVVAAYFAVAAGVKLPPFAKTTTPPTNQSQAYAALSKLIPAAIRADGSCSNEKNAHYGSDVTIAQISCNPANSSLPFNYIAYYLFPTGTALNGAYAQWLAEFAKTSENAGTCSFGSGETDTFAPCESSFTVGSSNATAGRIVQYVFKGVPDVSFTVNHERLLVDMEDSNGSAMVAWWAAHSSNWLAGKVY